MMENFAVSQTAFKEILMKFGTDRGDGVPAVRAGTMTAVSFAFDVTSAAHQFRCAGGDLRGQFRRSSPSGRAVRRG